MEKRYLKITIIFALTILVSANTLLFSQTWTSQSSGTVNILEAVWFKDAQNGWAVGNSGTSIFTSNGGQTWNPVNLTADDLHDVTFLDLSIGLIVGDNGRIYRTTNGGTNWLPITSGTTSNLVAVIFGQGGMAYVGGRDGVILRSSDSGASWTVAETGTVRYRGAAAIGSQNAWIVGDGGKIRATTNSGTMWSDQSGGTTGDIHDVFFLSLTEGWIAGQNDMLRYTNDGGTIWTSRNNGINVGLEAVYFLNSNDGWTVGNGGNVFATKNGGLNWLPETSGTTQVLNDVFFLNQSNGWAVGENGTIIYRNSITGINDNNINLNGFSSELRLQQNYPNPFTLETTIGFVLPKTDRVKLEVYNIQGERVRTLINNMLESGYHTANWNGKDDSGRLLGPGYYLYRIETSDFSKTRQLLFLK
jgi:photosystem II stability/assembly factor-like uncharacterized protein